MVALPAVLGSPRNASAAPGLLMMVALPAVPPKNDKSLLLMMVALPAVLWSTKARARLLVMVALPAVLEFPKVIAPLLMMVALPPLTIMPAPLNVTPKGKSPKGLVK